MQTNFDSRREYIQKIKESFASEDLSGRNGPGFGGSGDEPDDSRERMPGSFWKLRILLGILCLIGFFMIHQTDWHWKGISEETIVAQLQKNYDMETVRNCFQEVTDFFHK